MATETATYIDGLDSAKPTSGETPGEGDDHLRLIKSTIKATFPNVTGAVSGTHTELNLIDGSSAGAIVNSKAVIYGAAGEVNATTLQLGGRTFWQTGGGDTTPVTLSAAVLQSYTGTGTSILTINLPASPTNGDVILLANASTQNMSVGRNGKTIDGAASDNTILANQIATLVYYSDNWTRQ